MSKNNYKVEEVSPTRIWVRNISFWTPISVNQLAGILEDLTSKGKKVISTLTVPSRGGGSKDYLIVLAP